MKLIIFLIASLFIFTGLIGFINSPNNLNINIKHNPYPVNVNNSVSYIREFPINLNNVPSGTGYYQQLITIGNASYPYSNYNINSQGSNIQFISQNNSYLYAWIQNINTTTITVWIKNFNSSTTINMQVFPEFENLFSENGYLGEAPQLTSIYAQYDNGKNVFPYYEDFKGTTMPSNMEVLPYGENQAGNFTIDNGVFLSASSGGTAMVIATVGVYNPIHTVLEAYTNYSYYGGIDYTANSNGNYTAGIPYYSPFYNVISALSPGSDYYVLNNGTSVASQGNTYPSLSGNNLVGIMDDNGIALALNNKLYAFNSSINAPKMPLHIEFVVSNIVIHTALYYIFQRSINGNMPTFTIGAENSNISSALPSYQQLITISNPAKYGINTAGSNIEFTASNGVPLYAWVQSINNTSMKIWVKNYYNDSIVDMQVLPYFENRFNATGHLGEYGLIGNNFKMVFANITKTNAKLQFPFVAFTNFELSYPLEIFGYTEQNYTMSLHMEYTSSSSGGTGVVAAGQIITNGETGGGGSSSSGSGLEYYLLGYNGATYDQGTLNATGAIPYDYYDAFLSMDNGNDAFGSVNYTGMSDYSFSNYAIPTGGNLSVFGVDHATLEKVNYSYIYASLSPPVMPSFSIGSGEVLQANATTTSTFSGTPIGNYNATYVYDAYNIPVTPSANYVTVIFNSSWKLSNIYPSTFLPYQNNSNFVTIEDVSGFNSVQVTFIEPSQQIGTTTYQSIDYHMPEGITPPVNYFTNVIKITLFASAKNITEKTTSQFVQIPYGSSISVEVLDPWGDQVGEITNYLVANTTGSITIPLDVTELQFEFFNSTENYVYLLHNGINESFYNSAIVANDTTFKWFTSYYSVTTGQEQIKSGEVTTSEAIQPLLIYLKAPSGQLQVEVNAFNGSNLGTLSNSGNPRVLSFIDGVQYTLGSTFTGYQGSTYEIRIADLLNQTLLETNVTLQSSFTSLTERITTPSYWMGIENDEQIPQNSPLATEYISLNRTGSDKYYNFTDSVGQNWKGYFLAGNYTIHMHDNVTNTFFVNISRSNQQYYLNGQALLNLTDFDKKINKLLNYTKSVENTTYGLRLVPSSSSVSVLTDQKATFSWNVYYQNYTDFPSNYLKNSTVFVQIRNSTGAVQSFAANTTVSGNSIIYTATPTISGYFTVSIDALYGKYAGSSSQVLQVSSPQKVSVGMSVSFGIAQSLDTNKSYVVPIYLLYGNGTRFNLSDTGNAFPYATLYILQGNTVVHTYAPVNYSAGTIDFDIAPLSTGQYTFYASISQFNLSGSPVHAAITQTETVQPPVLSALGQFEAFWEEIGHGLVANLLYTIIGTTAILVGAWALRKFIKWIRGDKATDAKITNQILANAIQKIQRPYDNLAQVLPIFMSLEYSEQSAFLLASHEVLRLREITIGKKKSNLEKVRDYIVKVKRQPDGESLLEKIEKRFASKNKK